MAQQASGYHVDRSMVHTSQEPMSSLANIEEADLKLAASAINDKDLVQAGWLTGTKLFFLFAGSKLRDQAGCNMGLEALVSSRQQISE